MHFVIYALAITLSLGIALLIAAVALLTYLEYSMLLPTSASEPAMRSASKGNQNMNRPSNSVRTSVAANSQDSR